MQGPFDRDEQMLKIEEATLDARIRDFIKRYEPEDRRYRLDFECDLHAIVRAIYQEAQRPFSKALSEAVMRMPVPPVIFPMERRDPATAADHIVGAPK